MTTLHAEVTKTERFIVHVDIQKLIDEKSPYYKDWLRYQEEHPNPLWGNFAREVLDELRYEIINEGPWDEDEAGIIVMGDYDEIDIEWLGAS